MKHALRKLNRVLSRLTQRRRSEIDSELSSSMISAYKEEREVGMERSLETLAKVRFGLDVKVAVFKRVKRGQVLALVRLLSAKQTAPEDPQTFVRELVVEYNAVAHLMFQKHIDFAIWSDISAKPTQVHSQWEVVQRAS